MMSFIVGGVTMKVITIRGIDAEMSVKLKQVAESEKKERESTGFRFA